MSLLKRDLKRFDTDMDAAKKRFHDALERRKRLLESGRAAAGEFADASQRRTLARADAVVLAARDSMRATIDAFLKKKPRRVLPNPQRAALLKRALADRIDGELFQAEVWAEGHGDQTGRNIFDRQEGSRTEGQFVRRVKGYGKPPAIARGFTPDQVRRAMKRRAGLDYETLRGNALQQIAREDPALIHQRGVIAFPHQALRPCKACGVPHTGTRHRSHGVGASGRKGVSVKSSEIERGGPVIRPEDLLPDWVIDNPGLTYPTPIGVRCPICGRTDGGHKFASCADPPPRPVRPQGELFEKIRVVPLLPSTKGQPGLFNPRQKSEIIYGQVVEILCRRTNAHRCSPACKKAGHLYRHKFEGRRPALYGVRGGKAVVIK